MQSLSVTRVIQFILWRKMSFSSLMIRERLTLEKRGKSLKSRETGISSIYYRESNLKMVELLLNRVVTIVMVTIQTPNKVRKMLK